MPDLYTIARLCLLEYEVDAKIQRTRQAVRDWRAGKLLLDAGLPPVPILEPGRPERPVLVATRDLPRRRVGSSAGHAALIHAIAHIEFNAINLAWDAIYRFRGLPHDFYADWLRVADEEAQHFVLLRAHLRTLGYDYGDFEAHNGLWEMALKTAHDPLVRMALVPRVLEARGLDVTPGMIRRLQQLGDHKAVEILDIILREEIGHVEIGTRWFHYLCKQRGVEPEETFYQLIHEYMDGNIKPPFHTDARRQAGFSEDELRHLENLG